MWKRTTPTSAAPSRSCRFDGSLANDVIIQASFKHQHRFFFFFVFFIIRGEDSAAVRELGPFDFVICADLVYGGKEEAHRALLATLRELAADASSSTSPARHQMAIFFAYTPREVSREAVFFHRARRYFELIKVPPSTLPPEMQARGMEIFTFLPKELNN